MVSRRHTVEICPLPLPRQEHLHLLLRAWWTKLRASPTRKLTCRQGAGKGIHRAGQQQTCGGGRGLWPRDSLLPAQTAGPDTGYQKLVGPRAQEAWDDTPATS